MRGGAPVRGIQNNNDRTDARGPEQSGEAPAYALSVVVVVVFIVRWCVYCAVCVVRVVVWWWWCLL